MLADILGLSDDDQTKIMALALSKSQLDFLSLIQETMDDLAPRGVPKDLIENTWRNHS